jgi:hypothetical protein
MTHAEKMGDTQRGGEVGGGGKEDCAWGGLQRWWRWNGGRERSLRGRSCGIQCLLGSVRSENGTPKETGAGDAVGFEKGGLRLAR